MSTSSLGDEINQRYRPVKRISALCRRYQDKLIAFYWAGSYPIYAKLWRKGDFKLRFNYLADNIRNLATLAESAYNRSSQIKNSAFCGQTTKDKMGLRSPNPSYRLDYTDKHTLP
jgi:hypothetical protein